MKKIALSNLQQKRWFLTNYNYSLFIFQTNATIVRAEAIFPVQWCYHWLLAVCGSIANKLQLSGGSADHITKSTVEQNTLYLLSILG